MIPTTAVTNENRDKSHLYIKYSYIYFFFYWSVWSRSVLSLYSREGWLDLFLYHLSKYFFQSILGWPETSYGTYELIVHGSISGFGWLYDTEEGLPLPVPPLTMIYSKLFGFILTTTTCVYHCRTKSQRRFGISWVRASVLGQRYVTLDEILGWARCQFVFMRRAEKEHHDENTLRQFTGYT